MAHAPENSLAAFELALALGATGLESDARITADGEVVLHHDSRFRPALPRLRTRKVRAAERSDMPASVLTPAELYAACGTKFEFSVDIKDPDAAPGVVAAARRAGAESPRRLWLCSGSLQLLEQWRERWEDVKLVLSIRRRSMEFGAEQLAAQLSRQKINAVNMPYADWTGGTAALFHRFGVLAFGWDAQHDRTLGELLDSGLDGIYSDHVDRMMRAIAQYYG